jgi:DNA-binding NarL/FixJ family response regulator
MASQRCRVLIVDDHTLFRQGLRALLDGLPDHLVVGEVGDGGEAVRRAVLLRPDLVLLAARLPHPGTAAVTVELRERVPEARVIVLGADGDDPDAMYAAIRGGAMGYLPTTSGIGELVAAMRQVAGGHAAVPAAVLTRLVGSISCRVSAPKPVSRHGLSEREQEVLELVAQGRTNPEIAEALCISESTARSHLRSILAKLNVDNRVQAAAFAHGQRGRSRSVGAPPPAAIPIERGVSRLRPDRERAIPDAG